MHFLIILYHALRSTFFFFNDTATTEIYTLSLHDALPICVRKNDLLRDPAGGWVEDLAKSAVMRALRRERLAVDPYREDRKSTRLNSSHLVISYAVFCLKKKKRMNKVINAARHSLVYVVYC